MPKTTTVPTPTEAEQLKARLAELKEREKAAREEAKAIREKERAEREEAAKARAAEAEQIAEQRKEVEAELTAALDEMVAAKTALDEAKAKVEEIKSRLPRSPRSTNGTPRGPRIPRDPSKLTAAQTRILAWFHSEGIKSATRQGMSDAGGGKENTQYDGSVIGNFDVATRNPYSLLGRGYLEVDEVDNDGKKARVYSLTPEGKKAAKEAAKHLAASAKS